MCSHLTGIPLAYAQPNLAGQHYLRNFQKRCKVLPHSGVGNIIGQITLIVLNYFTQFPNIFNIFPYKFTLSLNIVLFE